MLDDQVYYLRTWKFSTRTRQKRYAAVVRVGLYSQPRLLWRTFKKASDAASYGRRVAARINALSNLG